MAELTCRRLGAEAGYPNTTLAGKLKTVSQLLKADLAARVFYTVQSGYDTHAGQSNSHFGLLMSFPARSRRSSTTWPPRNWPIA